MRLQSVLKNLITTGLLILISASSLAQSLYTNINSEDLVTLKADGVPVIDVRTEKEWQQSGVIPETYLITFFDDNGNVRPDFTDKLEDLIISKDSPLILICENGVKSRKIAEALAKQGGLTKIYNHEKGIDHWLATSHKTIPFEHKLMSARYVGN